MSQTIKTKPATEEYRENYDKIFRDYKEETSKQIERTCRTCGKTLHSYEPGPTCVTCQRKDSQTIYGAVPKEFWSKP